MFADPTGIEPFSEIDRINDPFRLMVLEKLLTVKNKRIDFATKHHRNTHGRKMDFRSHKHLSDLYNTLAPVLVLQGSVQSMKSELVVIDQFACAASGLNVFTILPKYELRGTYVQNRIDRCIDIVPEYQRHIGSGGFSNVAMKQFGKGVIKFVGSNVISDFKEFPADVMFVEEVDECNEDNVELGQDRLRGSPYQFLRYVGNPRIEDRGVNKKYKRSNQQEWHVECECGTPSRLDWFENIVNLVLDSDGVPKDFELLDQDWREGSDIRTICRGCGDPFDRFGEGFWKELNPGCSAEGFLLTMMMSRFNSLTEMFYRFREAFGDPAAMQRFFNSSLGLPFTNLDSRLTDLHLKKAAQLDEYSFRHHSTYSCIEDDSHEGPCSMGIDVGKWFDVRISRVMDNGTRKAVYIGKVMSREELILLGLRYNVEVAVIDSLPEAKVAQDLQDDSPFYVWLCRYGGEGGDSRIKKNKKDRGFTVDRTSILDKTLAELKSGRNILPRNYSSIMDDQFVKEMTVSVRQCIDDKNGNQRYVWTKGKDHQRHADVYDYLASTMMTTSVDILGGASVG